MRRVAVTIVIIAVCTLATERDAKAYTTCEQTPQGELCISQVDFTGFAQEAYMSQLQSQWCWAASISMVFAHHGYQVSQQRIVTDVYGSPENLPAMAGIVIANQLNRCWVDDFGDSFQSTVTGAYDADYGVYALTNQQIVYELDQDRPMVIGARTHAMVLTAVQYYRTPQGPNIVAAGVFDPWPGVGARALATDELYPVHLGGSLRFLATVSVSDYTGECPIAPPPEYPDGGCTASGRHAPTGFVLLLLTAVWTLRRRR